MFTAEIRINGALVNHIYGRNINTEGFTSRYYYEFYVVESGEVITGEVDHDRADGINELIVKIIKAAQ